MLQFGKCMQECLIMSKRLKHRLNKPESRESPPHTFKYSSTEDMNTHIVPWSFSGNISIATCKTD